LLARGDAIGGPRFPFVCRSQFVERISAFGRCSLVCGQQFGLTALSLRQGHPAEISFRLANAKHCIKAKGCHL
jgi:hypothetical protein